MTTLAAQWPFVALALVGGLHCAGMCGGFSALATRGVQLRRRFFERQIAYLFGKAATYALLGLLIASGVGGLAGELSEVRRVAALLAGAMLLVAGFGVLGYPLGGRLAARVPASLRGLGLRAREGLHALVALPGYAGALGLGLATGLLPCGLSWSAFALAATLPPHEAALGCFLFGLGTAPALLALGLGWRRVAGRPARPLLRASAGLLLVAFGLFTMARGASFAARPELARALLPECCEEAERATPPSETRER